MVISSKLSVPRDHISSLPIVFDVVLNASLTSLLKEPFRALAFTGPLCKQKNTPSGKKQVLPPLGEGFDALGGRRGGTTSPRRPTQGTGLCKQVMGWTSALATSLSLASLCSTQMVEPYTAALHFQIIHQERMRAEYQF